MDEDTGKLKINDIAIIGMAVNLPEAETLDDFWFNLKEMKCSVGPLSTVRQKDVDDYLKYSGNQRYLDRSLAKGFLKHIDCFDYAFFDISEEEAKVIDPCQRLFLQNVWAALEDASCDLEKLRGSDTGVFYGFSRGAQYKTHAHMVEEFGVTLLNQSISGNLDSVVGGRISYYFDLKGPCVSFDTACSSSLVALYYACEEIRNGKCSQAIVGTINIDLIPVDRNNKFALTSHSDTTKTFDDAADGTAWGEGVVSLILKPLEKAQNDGDYIYAVIRGGAVNHDGKSIGLTAPDPAAQAELIKSAWRSSGVEPESISFIEVHGTATKIGDPIEAEGISRAFNEYTKRKQFCAVSSVKSNIGHLECGAGLAGVAKTILALKNKVLPGIANFNIPNKLIDFEDSPIYLSDNTSEWENNNNFPRRCGVNSFGLSGTNCHIVLEEAPLGLFSENTNLLLNIFTISAKTNTSLKNLIKKYINYFRNNPDINLSDICYVSNLFRVHHQKRIAIIIESLDDLIEKLEKIINKDFSHLKNILIFESEFKIVENRKIRDFFISEYEFKDKIKFKKILSEMAALYVQGEKINWRSIYLAKRNKLSLPTYAFEETRAWLDFSSRLEKKKNFPLIDECIFKNSEKEIYVSRLNLKNDWVLSGHKARGNYILVGTAYIELAAEAVYGKFEDNKFQFRDILYSTPLVCSDDSSKDIRITLEKDLLAYNFKIESLIINESGEESWLLHAEGIVEELKNIDNGIIDAEIIKKSTKIKYTKEVLRKRMYEISNYEFDERWENIENVYELQKENEWLMDISMQKNYLLELNDFIVHPALFDNIFPTELVAKRDDIYLPFSYKKIEFFRSLPSDFYSYVKMNKNSRKDILDLEIILFDKAGNILAKIDNYLYKKSDSLSSFNPFFKLSWKSVDNDISIDVTSDKRISLVFKGKSLRASEILSEIKKIYPNIIEVEFGKEFEKKNNRSFIVGPLQSDMKKLFYELEALNIEKIFHFSSLRNEVEVNTFLSLQESQLAGVIGLFRVLKNLQIKENTKIVDLVIVSDFVSSISGREKIIKPENATLFGFAKAISFEEKNFNFKLIDIDEQSSTLNICTEIFSNSNELKVAWRENARYIEELERIDIKSEDSNQLQIVEDGVYLVTGGTSGLGLLFAKHLSEKKLIKLILLSRSGLPEKNLWMDILNNKNSNRELVRKIKTIIDIEESGSKVEVFRANVANEEEMNLLFSNIKNKYKKLNGIIHSAGLAGDGFLINKSEETFRSVLEPKVQGTWLLNNLTRDDNLDFFISFSSTVSIHGAPGQSDYMSANSYLDSFTHYRNKFSRNNKTINWASWQEVGMFVDKKTKFDIFFPLSTKNALEYFDEFFSKKLSNVMIGDLNEKSELFVENKMMDIFSKSIQKGIKIKNKLIDLESFKKEIKLSGRENNNYSELEKTVARIWSFVLGRDEIRLEDNFFELGGDSLGAMRVLALANKELNLQLSVIDLFKYPTIQGLVSSIEGEKLVNIVETKNEFKENTYRLIDEIKKGEISVDEALNEIGS